MEKAQLDLAGITPPQGFVTLKLFADPVSV